MCGTSRRRSSYIPQISVPLAFNDHCMVSIARSSQCSIAVSFLFTLLLLFCLARMCVTIYASSSADQNESRVAFRLFCFLLPSMCLMSSFQWSLVCTLSRVNERYKVEENRTRWTNGAVLTIHSIVIPKYLYVRVHISKKRSLVHCRVCYHFLHLSSPQLYVLLNYDIIRGIKTKRMYDCRTRARETKWFQRSSIISKKSPIDHSIEDNQTAIDRHRTALMFVLNQSFAALSSRVLQRKRKAQ